MPDPKNNAKATGDTHPPEVEDDATTAAHPEAEGSDDTSADTSVRRDGADELGDDVGQRVLLVEPAADDQPDRDRRVEVGSRGWPEGEDERHEDADGCGGVLEQLQAHVAGTEPLGGDARADDPGHQEGGPDPLGQRLAGEQLRLSSSRG